MDVFSIARACLRRWYVLVPLLLVTALAAFLQARSVEPQYSATATSIIVAPSVTAQQATSDNPLPVNPLGSIATTQVALVERLNSAQAAATVAAITGGAGAFSALAARQGGIITVSVVSSSARGASVTLDAALAQVPTQLQQLQAELQAPNGAFFRAVTLTGNQGVSAAYPQRTKNIVLVALAGALASIILVQLLDLVLERRSHRRRLLPPPTESEPPHDLSLDDLSLTHSDRQG